MATSSAATQINVFIPPSPLLGAMVIRIDGKACEKSQIASDVGATLAVALSGEVLHNPADHEVGRDHKRRPYSGQCLEDAACERPLSLGRDPQWLNPATEFVG